MSNYYKNNQIVIVIISIICPPIGLLASLYALKRGYYNWRYLIFCIAWSFAIFAYCYEPTTNSDLVRYFEYLDLLEGKSFLDAFRIGQYGKDNLYSFVFLGWLVANVGDIRLLPAISTFSVYYIGLFVTCKICEDASLDKRDCFRYILIIIFSLSLYGIVNNIRNIWAFSLVCYAIFRDVYSKKRDLVTLFLYVFPLFLHSSAILFVIIRIILVAPKKIKVICSFLCFFVPLLLNMLSSKFSGASSKNIFLNMLFGTIQSGNNYFEHSNSAWAIVAQNSGSERLARIIYMSIAALLFIMFMVILKEVNKNKISINEEINKIIDLPFLACLLTFSCVTMVMPEYWRFVSIAIIFGGCIFLVSSTITKIPNRIMLLLSISSAVLWIRNLFLYSDVTVTIVRCLIANPIVIIFLKSFSEGIEIIQ